MPVSSRTSRWAASRLLSPSSMWPLGSASTRDPSEARRVGTITTSSSPRTSTPPAERSRTTRLLALRRGFLEDILLQRLDVVHREAAAALGDHAGALEHREKATGRLPRGAGELGEVRLG